jgi:hypothetical protein
MKGIPPNVPLYIQHGEDISGNFLNEKKKKKKNMAQ